MKFDVVLGNPPFQHPSNPFKKTWEDFVRLSFSLAKDSGIVALIHPLNWMSNKDNMLVQYFSEKTPLFVNIKECGKYFPHVSTMIGYEIIKNEPNTKKQSTPILTKGGIYEINFLDIVFLPNDINKNVLSILEKTIYNTNHKKLMFIRSSETGTGKIVKDVPTNVYKYPVFRGWSKATGILWGYSSKPHSLHNKPKVIFQEFSTDNKGFFVGTTAATENGYMMVCDTKIQATNLKTIMLSRLFQFLILQLKHTRTIRPHILNLLPKIDLSHSWTDEELNKHFNLTEEEIKLIEKIVK